MNIEDITTVGMAGAGSMGAGIAQIAAMAGLQVKVVDVSEAVWSPSEKTIAKSLERIVKKGTITEDEMKAVLARITFSTDVASLAGVPFIFEAVFEDINVKRSSSPSLMPSAARTPSTPPIPLPWPSLKWLRW